MDPKRLDVALAENFGGEPEERRVVARQARDLADSGKAERDRDQAVTTSDIVRQLADAPPESDVVERWNWWMGALDTAYGGYQRFTVRTVPGDEAADLYR